MQKSILFFENKILERVLPEPLREKEKGRGIERVGETEWMGGFLGMTKISSTH